MKRATPLGDRQIDRRRLMQGMAIGAGLFGGISDRRRLLARDDRPTLRLLGWAGYGDRELTAPFREERGVEIETTPIGANDELFTFLRAGGLGRYDVVTPQNGVVRALVAVGLLQPLDAARLTHLPDLFPRFRQPEWANVDGVPYGVPVLWGASPMVYAAERLPEPPAAWEDLLAARFKGRVAMNEDGLGHFLIWNAVQGHPDPTRVTVGDLNETTDLLIRLKRDYAAVFAPNMDVLAGALADGRAWASSIGWESVPFLEAARGADLRLAHPSPGDYAFADALCVAADAPRPDLAHAFIDFFLSPETQARLINKLKRGTVNARAVALLDESVRAIYAYDDLDAVFARSPLRGFPPISDEGGDVATYVDWVKAWERVRVTQMKARR